jgi:hypothetical protein
MPLGDFPLTKLDALPDAMKRDAYQIWLWSLEGSAFDCPLEPLTQEFWQTHLESRLAYGLLLPTRDHQKEENLLVLISQKLTRAISRQYGRLPLRPRYQLFNFIMDIGLPNTEHLTSLHPFVRISNFKMFEEIFRSAILPIKDEKGKYRRPTFAGTIDVLPDGLTNSASLSKVRTNTDLARKCNPLEYLSRCGGPVRGKGVLRLRYV